MLTDKLKKFRKDKKLTQTKLAELCGISRNSIVNWETGKSTPKVGDIEKISLVLGISPRELMEGSLSVQDKETSIHEQLTPKGFAYWGGVVDEARRAAERGDEIEITQIEPLLKLAYEMLLSGVERLNKRKIKTKAHNVSAYNGNHSSYTGNTLTVSAMA